QRGQVDAVGDDLALGAQPLALGTCGLGRDGDAYGDPPEVTAQEAGGGIEAREVVDRRVEGGDDGDARRPRGAQRERRGGRGGGLVHVEDVEVVVAHPAAGTPRGRQQRRDVSHRAVEPEPEARSRDGLLRSTRAPAGGEREYVVAS